MILVISFGTFKRLEIKDTSDKLIGTVICKYTDCWSVSFKEQYL